MRPRLALRELALAAIALLAAVTALAITNRVRAEPPSGPVPVGAYVALAGSSGPAAFGRRTSCGGVLGVETEGIEHPTLPCGTRILLTYHGQTFLTAVIDRGPVPSGRQFDLTDALARRVGLRGVQPVHWAYATRAR